MRWLRKLVRGNVGRRFFSYHVAYDFKKGMSTGYGAVNILRPYKIRTNEDVKGIAQFIESENDMESVAIKNWKRLKNVRL